MESALISSRGLCLYQILVPAFGNIYRCDNLNDCRDKSDEANCKRVNIFFSQSEKSIAVLLLLPDFFTTRLFVLPTQSCYIQVKMVPTYQKFIVPPPLMTDNMTKVTFYFLLFSAFWRFYTFQCI